MVSFGDQVCTEVPRLRRYARSLTRNNTSADDLVQSTLTRALSREHLWEPGTDLRAWLFTLLHNQHVNNVRKAAREGIQVEVSEMLPAHDRADASITNEEVELALSLLPTEQREALILVGLESLTYEQAAFILGIPVGTLRSRLSRGRALLRDLLDGAVFEKGHTLRSVAAKVASAHRRARYL